MKLKIDRFKEFQKEIKRAPSWATDIDTLPNPFLRVLKLLEESGRDRLSGWPFVTDGIAWTDITTTDNLTVDTGTNDFTFQPQWRVN